MCAIGGAGKFSDFFPNFTKYMMKSIRGHFNFVVFQAKIGFHGIVISHFKQIRIGRNFNEVKKSRNFWNLFS